MVGDEVWLAEKFQSNPEIAGSLRNSFRASLKIESNGGRALNVLGGIALTEDYQTPNTVYLCLGVRQCQINVIVKWETAQIYSYGPKVRLSGKRCEDT